MSDPFERAAVLARFNNDQKWLEEMVRLFGECSAAWLKEIRAALARNDLDQVMRLAHTLKGSVGNFLAYDAAAAAKTLESACRAGQADAARDAFAALEAAVQQLNAGLKSLAAS